MDVFAEKSRLGAPSIHVSVLFFLEIIAVWNIDGEKQLKKGLKKPIIRRNFDPKANCFYIETVQVIYHSQ